MATDVADGSTRARARSGLRAERGDRPQRGVFLEERAGPVSGNPRVPLAVAAEPADPPILSAGPFDRSAGDTAGGRCYRDARLKSNSGSRLWAWSRFRR